MHRVYKSMSDSEMYSTLITISCLEFQWILFNQFCMNFAQIVTLGRFGVHCLCSDTVEYFN